MLIGIDASQANREQKTGVEWYSYHLIQQMKKIPVPSGINFVLCSRHPLRGELARLPEGWQSRILSWPLKYCWTQLRLAAEMFVHPPDLLFVPGYALPFFCPVAGVVTVHDLGFRRFPRTYSLGQRFFYSLVHARVLRQARGIIVPSQFTKREIENLFQTASEKIKVIPLGYAANVFYPRPEEESEAILKKYQINPPYFLYLGRLTSKKNISLLLKSFSRLRREDDRISLVLVGQPGYGYREIKRQITAGEGIKELGYLSYEDLPYLYSRALAFVLPSWYEGFGLPLLEAMACGAPLIAARSGSLPEVAEQAALYFNPREKNTLFEAMKKIRQDDGLRQSLRRRGLERVREFSWEKCARQTIDYLVGQLTEND